MKALVSVFFLFSSPLPVFVGGTLAPEPLLPRCSILADCPCFPAWRKAYRLHPPSTSCVWQVRLWFKLTAGPLLRGIQAVLQELAGSATGGRGRMDAGL